MMDALAADFHLRVGPEDFDELVWRELQVKSEQLAVLEKIEMRFQSQRAAVEIPAVLQVFRKDADVCERFDHVRFEKDYKARTEESNQWKRRLKKRAAISRRAERSLTKYFSAASIAA
jgi:hypothetical protein